MSAGSSLYDRLGGEPAIDAAVEAFYERVTTDASLAPFFESVDVAAQARKQKQFLTYAFGGPTKWTGRTLRAAHTNAVERGLSDAHFDAVAGHLEATLRALGVPDGPVKEVLEIAGSTREDVLGR